MELRVNIANCSNPAGLFPRHKSNPSEYLPQMSVMYND